MAVRMLLGSEWQVGAMASTFILSQASRTTLRSFQIPTAGRPSKPFTQGTAAPPTRFANDSAQA